MTPPERQRSVNDRKPTHGDTVTVVIPARTVRRRWCAICHVWTWEVSESGVFRHGQNTRTEECREARTP